MSRTKGDELSTTSVNVHVKSSFIKRVNYNKQSRNLIVTFTNSKYIFEDVPASEATELLMSDGSSGEIFNRKIKGKYNSFKV